jgi:glycosyltransferase involved in cell wall biosynthesis
MRDKSLIDSSLVVALNDSEDLDQYTYPEEVQYIIRQKHQEDYLKTAALLNNGPADACILQHEFGIYGGESGIYILPFLNAVKKPLITILHTVLKSPTFLQKSIIREIAKKSAKVVVMSKKAIIFLTEIYEVSREKIQFIEHGVPDLEAPAQNPVKGLPALQNKKILLTFGLLSRNKGLETVIRALPKIVANHPEVMYVILGNTHPGILKHEGEEYRNYLKQLAVDLKVEKHLLFINKFVSEEDLIDYLTAADIYITPYYNEAQITSGTLSYAIGAGAAVVSTPYWHAQELLAENRGCLFDFKDDKALFQIIDHLFVNPVKLQDLKKNAYRYGLKLRWPRIGREYISLLERAINYPDYSDKILKQIIDHEVMPEFSLDYIKRLTDDTGIIQHAKYGIPNRNEGYCLDDNARALIMALMAYQVDKRQEALDLLPTYLSYIHYMQTEEGNFRNFLSYDRKFLEKEGSEDSFGRTIWALGYLIYAAPNNSYQEFGHELLIKSVPHFQKLTHIRGICNTITGIAYYLKVHSSDKQMAKEMVALTDKLVNAYQNTHGPNWNWFENHLTYDNAILPLALFHSSEFTGNKRVTSIALESLDFLEKLTLNTEYLNPIGNDGWYLRDGQIPLHDQQAIETMAMVLMYFQAYKVTQEPQYIKKMFSCYLWFLGENSLRVPLYDYETKGCCDGLQPTGINRNQGAESTLAYLISHLTVLMAFEHEYEHLQNREVMESMFIK